MIQDLAEGDPQKTLIGYTLPMFISVVFQQFYNMADSMIAGRFAGEDALAAVHGIYLYGSDPAGAFGVSLIRSVEGDRNLAFLACGLVDRGGHVMDLLPEGFEWRII